MDAAAVNRIYPSIDQGRLERAFRDLAAQEFRVQPETISITGTTATVTARVQQSITPRAGSGRQDTVASEFRLQKIDGRWVILERR